jgi:hypothetical protein
MVAVVALIGIYRQTGYRFHNGRLTTNTWPAVSRRFPSTRETLMCIEAAATGTSGPNVTAIGSLVSALATG